MGYPYNKKGWRLYDLEQHTFFYSRDVSFHEDTLPFAQAIHDTVQSVVNPVSNLFDDLEGSEHVMKEPEHANDGHDVSPNSRGSSRSV